MDSKDIADESVDFESTEICPFDDYDKEAAKERASVLWLLSKAYSGIIPDDLREPFYRDKEHQRRLKTKIVHSLANAELYCLSLVNIYSDPNYHNLNHHGVIQALMRKGICLVETKDAPLTETVLVQTAPIRMNAHMAVIEGVMSLYIKEVLIPEKVVEAVRGFAHVSINSEMPTTPEEAAVLWINKCCTTLEQEIKAEWRTHEESLEKLPQIPVLQEISDISDGCSLAAVISFYCPNYFKWQDVCWNDPMSIGDSIYNLQLVKRFCRSNLPHQIDFLSLEDFLYVHPSIKDNILVFVADLLYLFVIWPASCVTRHVANDYEETSQIQLEGFKSRSNSLTSHKTHQVSYNQIPNLRTDSHGGSTSSLPEIKTGGRSGAYKESLERQIQGKKSGLSNDSSEGSYLLQRTSSAGVVNGSKSNTSSFDGSGDNLRHKNTINKKKNIIERSATDEFIENQDQSRGLRKKADSQGMCGDHNNGLSNGTSQSSVGRRSSGLEDYYNQLASDDGPLKNDLSTNIRDVKNWKNSNDKPDFKFRDSSSSQSSGICISDIDNKNLPTTSFAQLSKLRDANSNAINIVYMQHDREGPDGDKSLSKSSFLQKIKQKEKRTTFATLPNTTTWQQQRAISSSSPQTDSGHETPTDTVDPALNVQLANIRMKLEEKRRKIELEKKRMEALWKRQRQKLGKAAFLQAVSRGSGTEANTPDSGTGKDVSETDLLLLKEKSNITCSPSLVRRMSMQEIAEDLDSVQKKWLEEHNTSEPSLVVAKELDTVDAESMNVNDFQSSIEQLNTSLCDLQADISRITFQQEHIENLMQDSVEESSHFFLHGQPTKRYELESPSVHSYQMERHSAQVAGKMQQEVNGGLLPISPQRHFTQKQNDAQQKLFTQQQLPTPVHIIPDGKQDYIMNAEDLYSKVIKPENRQKTVPAQPHSLPLQKNVHEVRELPHLKTSEYPQDRFSSVKPSHEFQTFTLKTSESSLPNHGTITSTPLTNEAPQNFHRKKLSLENDQGFYIPLDDHSKKFKTKWKRPTAKNDHIDSFQLHDHISSSSPSKKDVTKEDTSNSFGFVIGADLVHPDPETEIEMAKKKEMIMTLSIKRRIDHENRRAAKEQEYARLREEEQRKREYQERKREEEKQRRQAILEQYRQRKLQEELEKEGGSIQGGNISNMTSMKSHGAGVAKPRNKPSAKPRPKSAYVGDGAVPNIDSVINKRNSQLICTGKNTPDFDVDSLNSTSTSASSHDKGHSSNCSGTNHPHMSLTQRGESSLRVPEGSGPSSDGASDTASNSSSAMAPEYTGPKLFVKPTAKSNRGIIINAINTVLAGAVNADTKKKVLEEINRSDSKHFLILFRDAGCQFRALYSYNPDREEVTKLYGIGPKVVPDKIMDRFYKYNSGGKCFSEVQTKHLTVTIDAFTIPNSLWAGRKFVPPRKEFL